MKILELLQRVKSLYDVGVGFDDSRLTYRHIYSTMMSMYHKLLFENYNKNRKVSPFSWYTLHCVELIEVPQNDCPCVPPIGCTILRSKYPLPKILQFGNNLMIQSVSSIDGQMTFAQTTLNKKKYKSGSKFTSKKPDYFIKDNFLFLTVNTKIRLISISALFSDFIEAGKFIEFCDKKNHDCCKAMYEYDIVIDEYLVKPLVQLTAEELIMIMKTGQTPQVDEQQQSL